MADGTVRLTIDCQEQPGETEAQLLALRQQLITLLVVPAEADRPTEVPPQPKPEKGAQTPSQRLRQALFKEWQSLGSPAAFQVYYEAAIDTIIRKL